MAHVDGDGRWSRERAAAWAAARGWQCGVNFLPSTAVNFLEMWHRDTFDAATIDRELGWAADLGFTAIRTNLPYLVWRHDADGLIERLDRLLGIAARHGLTVAPCLFDDCGFGGAEPVYGRQADPVPGVHNSRAVASPGRSVVGDAAERPALERYVRAVVAAFARDPRILFWDLYNEPGNGMVFSTDGLDAAAGDFAADSRSLMIQAFGRAREVAPDQPLTVAAWVTPRPEDAAAGFRSPIDVDALDLSDIVTFHAYLPAAATAALIASLVERGRPMLCTEWMARAAGSRIADQLPLFRRQGVGCFQWGLVRGRTQTHLPWPEALLRRHGGVPDRSVWFHDLLEPDGTPYDPAEIAVIRDARAR